MTSYILFEVSDNLRFKMTKLIICLVLLFAFKAFSAEEESSNTDQQVSASAELSSKQLKAIKKSLEKARLKNEESV